MVERDKAGLRQSDDETDGSVHDASGVIQLAAMDPRSPEQKAFERQMAVGTGVQRDFDEALAVLAK